MNDESKASPLPIHNSQFILHRFERLSCLMLAHSLRGRNRNAPARSRSPTTLAGPDRHALLATHPDSRNLRAGTPGTRSGTAPLRGIAGGRSGAGRAAEGSGAARSGPNGTRRGVGEEGSRTFRVLRA